MLQFSSDVFIYKNIGYTSVSMEHDIKNSILSCICYFDIFDFPLTSEEIYKLRWGVGPVDYVLFSKILESLVNDKKLCFSQSFYFLPGREQTVEKRQSSACLISKKISIAKFSAKILRFIPFLQAFFVCNTVAAGAASENSDIDVFIIAKEKRLWTVRLLATIILSLFGKRRTKKRIENKICLSFYASENNLDFSKIAIKQPDIYLAYWIEHLIPVYDPFDKLNEVYNNNLWVKNYIPSAFSGFKCAEAWKVNDNMFSLMFKNSLEFCLQGMFGNLIEKVSRCVQKKKMSFNLNSIQNEKDARVVIKDDMLKFHENDRRELFKKLWEDNFKKYKLSC
jgi:hypothetical protein